MTDTQCRGRVGDSDYNTYTGVARLRYDAVQKDYISKYCLKNCNLIWPGSTPYGNGTMCRKSDGTTVSRESHSKCCLSGTCTIDNCNSSSSLYEWVDGKCLLKCHNIYGRYSSPLASDKTICINTGYGPTSRYIDGFTKYDC